MRLTPRQQEVLSLVLAAPNGVSRAELQVALGLSAVRVADHLRRIRRAGLIDATAVQGGKNAMWASPKVAAQIRASRIEERRHRPDTEAEIDEWLTPQHRVRPAAECAPIPVRGPRSVFDLGRWTA